MNNTDNTDMAQRNEADYFEEISRLLLRGSWIQYLIFTVGLFVLNYSSVFMKMTYEAKQIALPEVTTWLTKGFITIVAGVITVVLFRVAKKAKPPFSLWIMVISQLCFPLLAGIAAIAVIVPLIQLWSFFI